MRMIMALACVLASASALFAQASNSSSFTPAVPLAPAMGGMGGGYGFYGGTPGGGTVEGSMMQGMASVISAQGNYNLATSAAAVNTTQAIKQDITNRQDATNAYFAIKETNRAAVAAMRSPRLSEEQLVRMAAQASPKPIDSTEFDPVSGRVLWPKLLQADAFTQQRAIAEQLLAKQAQYGKLGLAEHEQAGEAIDGMSDRLRDMINAVSPQDYIEAKNFLKSLMYGLTKTQLS
jgi:hypothetical protein